MSKHRKGGGAVFNLIGVRAFHPGVKAENPWSNNEKPGHTPGQSAPAWPAPPPPRPPFGRSRGRRSQTVSVDCLTVCHPRDRTNLTWSNCSRLACSASAPPAAFQ